MVIISSFVIAFRHKKFLNSLVKLLSATRVLVREWSPQGKVKKKFNIVKIKKEERDSTAYYAHNENSSV